MGLVWLDVRAHSAEELGEACGEIGALGGDDLRLNCLSDLHQHVVENLSDVLLESRSY